MYYHCTGIDHKTLFLWQHKLIHALAQMQQPTLSGIVQIDERNSFRAGLKRFAENGIKNYRKLVSWSLV